MLNDARALSSFVSAVAETAARKAMRGNSGQYEGTWEYHKITPDTAYTMPNEFVWTSTVKYGSQANVAYAQRANCNLDIKIDNTHALKASNTLDASSIGVDSELFQDVQHPFYWPTPYYIAGGQRILFSGGTANTNSYYILHGFRPIKERAMQTTRIPFIYTMGWANIAQSTNNIDTLEILRNTKFVMTHVIAVQRLIDTSANYSVEVTNMNIEVNCVNTAIGRSTINSSMLFGTPSFPFKLDAPMIIDGGDSIYINGTSPAWGADNRDVFLYFIGIQLMA